MSFDLDDPLGSDDSFFEEPKALSRRTSAKSVEKKSVENLFNLADAKENPESSKSLPEFPQKTRNVVTFDESTIKQDDFSKPIVSEFSAKPQKKINDDWLGEPDSNTVEKKSKNTDFLEDLLSIRPSSPKDKKITASSEDVRKDTQFGTISKLSGSVKESSTPTDVMSNFSLLSNTSRERRRLRRGSSTGLEDALGLFGDDYQSGTFQDTKPPVSRTATVDVEPKTTITERGIPDWLGGSATSVAKPDAEVIRKAEDVKDTVITEAPKKATDEEKQVEKVTTEFDALTKNPKAYDDVLALKQQQINSDLQNTYASLQQQETFLLISLQLKKYEENLEGIKRQQREILEKQEKRFDTFLDKYAVKQQMIENNIRMQQERLNSHVQLLISQPFHEPDKEGSEHGETKKSQDRTDATSSIIQSLKQRHNEELFVMEESYKKQISLLEQSTEALEERLKKEISHITATFEEKVKVLNENYQEEIMFYKQKATSTEEQHDKNIQLIKEHHARVLEEMKSEYNSHIEHLKQLSNKENEFLADGELYSQKLNTTIDMLSSNSRVLEEVQGKIHRDADIISVARQSSIESREKEIILMRNTLEKSREAAENERSQLLALIRSLETKIAEQNVNGQEDRWALQQAAATLAARSAALDREIEYNRTVNEREREQLKTLKASLLAEQDKMIAQVTEEKLKVSAERARIETSSKLSNNYELERVKAEAEMAIEVAKDLSEKVNQERDYLNRQKSEIEALKRILADRARELQDKEMNLEYLTENTQKKINEDRKIINEAKRMENKYKERLQELQNQWASLADREKKLAEEKVLLSKERLVLYTTMKQSKSCVLCKSNDLPPQNNYYIDDNLPTFKISDTNGVRIRLDAIDDEKSSEVSREENAF